MPILNKDMQVCISLSARPSNLGTRFHNFLYDELGLNFVYKAFSTTDLEGAIRGMRALNFRGCSVSMPFKEDVIALVDNMAPSALAIESVNTIVNDNGVLTASNTDYEAVLTLLKDRQVDTGSSVLVRGSGGMAKAVVAAFREAGFTHLTVTARNEESGRALAERYDFSFESSDFLTSGRAGSEGFDVLVNVTPLGMSGPNESDLSFPAELIEQATTIIDVVAFPSDTPLIQAGHAAGTVIISGAEVIALQAALQFEAYTGVTLSADHVQRASVFSRHA